VKRPAKGEVDEARRQAAQLLRGWDVSAARKPQKHSIAIAGHRTSISLEEPFWDGLRMIADREGVSLAAIVAAIDAIRGEVSLSGAIRLFVYSRMAPETMTASVRIGG
jgi:predicted DNA-binding ribbon-helix-helix protein